MSSEPVEPSAPAQAGAQSTVEDRLRTLANALFWSAGIVLVLSIIGAITVASTQSLGLFAPEVEAQGRGFVAIGALGAGFTGAGMLAGLGGILRALLRRDGG
ncbi:MAG: hypothetical protein QOK04_1611 [Solirubrobacteraceae bacterium]|nr:hypothetical protein [Solirubrobacteraceae bacterium]